MGFELGQIWQNINDETSQAEVIEVSDNGLHAKISMITHGLGTTELDISAIAVGIQKWRLAPYRCGGIL
jgi:hypothetical protein